MPQAANLELRGEGLADGVANPGIQGDSRGQEFLRSQ